MQPLDAAKLLYQKHLKLQFWGTKRGKHLKSSFKLTRRMNFERTKAIYTSIDILLGRKTISKFQKLNLIGKYLTPKKKVLVSTKFFFFVHFIKDIFILFPNGYLLYVQIHKSDCHFLKHTKNIHQPQKSIHFDWKDKEHGYFQNNGKHKKPTYINHDNCTSNF